MSLIENELLKLRARSHEVIQILHHQLELFEDSILQKDWEGLRQVQQYRSEALAKDMRLDRRCARILALHQPVAQDLRFVLAVYRMHFHVTEISERLEALGMRLAENLPILPPDQLDQVPLGQLVQNVRRLLETCIEAFFESDVDRSKKIDQDDEAVDESYEQCITQIQRQVTHPCSLPEARAWLELAIAAKTLEKIADYALGIADASIYHAEGIYYWHRSHPKHDS